MTSGTKTLLYVLGGAAAIGGVGAAIYYATHPKSAPTSTGPLPPAGTVNKPPPSNLANMTLAEIANLVAVVPLHGNVEVPNNGNWQPPPQPMG